MEISISAYCAKSLLPSLLLVFITTVGIEGCKKDRQENKPGNIPPTEKKGVVTSVAGDGTVDFANGPGLSAKISFE